jgi:hypothetical protein
MHAAHLFAWKTSAMEAYARPRTAQQSAERGSSLHLYSIHGERGVAVLAWHAKPTVAIKVHVTSVVRQGVRLMK